jgi:hypothetical protein
MKKRTIIIITAIVLFIGGVGSGLGIYFYNQHLNELDKQQQENQYIESVYNTIAEYISLFNNTDNRDNKITLYNELSGFGHEFSSGSLPLYHEEIREQHYENMLSRFQNNLLSMENWFYDDYVSRIDDVKNQSVSNLNEREIFVEQKAFEINEAHNGFLLEIESYKEIECEDEECEHEHSPVSTLASRHYHDFSNYKDLFSENTFIDDKILNTEDFITELENIRLLIVQERIITDAERLQKLNESINYITGELSLQLADDDRENINNQFLSLVDSKYDWFIGHYDELIVGISEREREDQNDFDTIEKQAKDLEYLKETIINDGVAGGSDSELLLSRIDELIEGYNQEVTEIQERLEQERLERERQQRAQGSRGSGGGSRASSNAEWLNWPKHPVSGAPMHPETGLSHNGRPYHPDSGIEIWPNPTKNPVSCSACGAWEVLTLIEGGLWVWNAHDCANNIWTVIGRGVTPRP